MREHFLPDPDVVFLLHGSFGACPREVFDDDQRWHLELERNPVEFPGRRSGDLQTQAHTHLADDLGAHPADLAFVPNATTGLNTASASLQLLPGDAVLTTNPEYGASAAAGAHCRRVAVPLPFDESTWPAA